MALSAGGWEWTFMTAALMLGVTSALAVRRAIKERALRRWGSLALGLGLLAVALGLFSLGGVEVKGTVGYLALSGAVLLVLSPFSSGGEGPRGRPGGGTGDGTGGKGPD